VRLSRMNCAERMWGVEGACFSDLGQLFAGAKFRRTLNGSPPTLRLNVFFQSELPVVPSKIGHKS